MPSPTPAAPVSPPSSPPTTSWRERLTRRVTRVLATANLVCQIGIILTGGVVRLTGSGLGCSTWPQCEPGEFSPVLHPEATYHPFVEFGNRTLTGVLLVVALLLAAAVWNAPALRTRSRSLRLLALTPLLGVLAQALIGGITVLLHLHPGVVGFHFLVSAVLVWASTVLVVRLREGDDAPEPVLKPSGTSGRWLRAVPAVFAVLTLAVVVLGILTTGSGPHSGDDEVGYRFALDPVVLAKAHAWTVWLFVAALVATLVVVTRAVAGGRTDNAAPDPGSALDTARARALRQWWVLLAVTLLQGAIGYAQYFTGLPVPLVALHLLGSALLVSATTFAVLALRVRS